MGLFVCPSIGGGNTYPLVTLLVGGLEHVLFSHILGTIIPIDFHIFQRGGPTTNQINTNYPSNIIHLKAMG